MKVFYDQLDRKLELAAPPKRIVSLVPSQTELLVDLGLIDSLVGVTKFCVHPRSLKKEKRVVGGTKQVHLEKIRELQPDIILANKEENTAEMVASLEQISPVHVSDVKDIDDAIELIREYGEMFDRRKESSEIAGDILDQREDFEKFMQGKPVRRTVYLIWKRPLMAVGQKTFVDHLLELNKFENVFSGAHSRYPEVTTKQLVKAHPDLLLLSTEPYPFNEEDKEQFQQLDAIPSIRIVDGEFFSWYGSRLKAAFNYFKDLQSSLIFS